MPLSWNEIKGRALAFSKEWEDETSEGAEAQTFWNEFFNVFGINRRKVASFEKPVKKDDGAGGFIDLLWKGVLLVEHKSRDKDLDRAKRQAFDYFSGLKERDLPRYVVVSDFARIRLYDLDEDKTHNFPLTEFYKNVRLFGFIAGYQTRSFGQEDPVNIKAAERLGRLHDLLKATGYEGHPLEILLVRLLFCLFSDDTSIFERSQFQDYIEQRTSEDGSDLGMHMAQFFQVLNTPAEKRQRNLDEQLAAFPYVNGRLFEEALPLASFDSKMRDSLLECCALDWSRISPAIFGSLFQSIMDAKARRNLGAHYTTETNILKALHPLFIDSLRAEFERIKRNQKLLLEFHKKLASIRILDPACGCGNFLVIAYRELRLLELEVLRALHKDKADFLSVGEMIRVDVDQFYGIELEEFPAQIAQVAMWLMDHQMNLRVSEEFGQYFVRLPLKKAATIVNGNALRIDWREVVKPEALSYIVGNPPFVGRQYRTDEQRADMDDIFRTVRGAGVLDYVSCWYRKAAAHMGGNHAIRAAFVSTNSITQGEQVGILWPVLFASGVKINFAHRTFQWQSEARGKAAVHCVIIGFALEDEPEKWIFEYETLKSEPHAINAININPYLVDAPSVFLNKRRAPICGNELRMAFGSMPNDGGHLLLSTQEKDELLSAYPDAKRWIRPLLGSEEFINSKERWCLWLIGISPDVLRSMPAIVERVEAVNRARLRSTRATTQALSNNPTLFGEIRQPLSDYLAVPEVSSVNRPFIPIGFLSSATIASNKLYTIAGAKAFHFGVLSSTMHMAWVRSVCGRLKSDYQYSAGIVYNNFPWPEVTDKQREAIEKAAQGVLDARLKFPDSTLADLYDPIAMPPELRKAHQALDREVDKAYGKTSFASEAERVAFLFSLYQKLTSLLPEDKPKKGKKRQSR